MRAISNFGMYMLAKLWKKEARNSILTKDGTILIKYPSPQRTDTTQAPAILYIHGGAFCLNPPTEFTVVTEIFKRLKSTTVYSLHSPLLPEATFAEQRAAAMSAFLHLSEIHGKILVIGDSAGGNLALDLALSLDKADALVGLVLLSPFLRVSSVAVGGDDPGTDYLSVKWCSRYAHIYEEAGGPSDEDIADRVRNKKLPPCLCLVGGNEILRDDPVGLVDNVKLGQEDDVARYFGHRPILVSFPYEVHDFPLMQPGMMYDDTAIGRSWDMIESFFLFVSEA